MEHIEYKTNYRNGYHGIDRYENGKCIRMVEGLTSGAEAENICAELNELAAERNAAIEGENSANEALNLHRVQSDEALAFKNMQINNLRAELSDATDEVDYLQARVQELDEGSL